MNFPSLELLNKTLCFSFSFLAVSSCLPSIPPPFPPSGERLKIKRDSSPSVWLLSPEAVASGQLGKTWDSMVCQTPFPLSLCFSLCFPCLIHLTFLFAFYPPLLPYPSSLSPPLTLLIFLFRFLPRRLLPLFFPSPALHPPATPHPYLLSRRHRKRQQQEKETRSKNNPL